MIINYCNSTGEIGGSGNSEGCGIIAPLYGEKEYYGTATIQYCFSTGNITGDYCGGIYSGHTSGQTSYIKECYSTGNITGYNCGGITCSGSTTIEQCYSIGAINNYSSGIIAKMDTGRNMVKNSYSLGNINNYSSGIVGSLIVSDDGYLLENCYSQGTISNNSSGIVRLGSDSRYSYSSMIIKNCYSSGIYDTSSYPIVYGSIEYNGDYIDEYNNVTTSIVNCYASNGYWLDTDASNNLIIDLWYNNLDSTTINVPWILLICANDIVPSSSSSSSSSISTSSSSTSSSSSYPKTSLSILPQFNFISLTENTEQNNSISIPLSTKINLISKTISTQPSNGNAVIKGNTVLYTPNLLFVGINYFTVSFVIENITQNVNYSVIVSPIKIMYPTIWILKQSIDVDYLIYQRYIKDFNYCTANEKLKILYGSVDGTLIFKYLFYNIDKYSLYEIGDKNKCDQNVFKFCNSKYVKTEYSKKSIYKLYQYNLINILNKNTKKYLSKQVEKNLSKKYKIVCTKKSINQVLYICKSKC